MTEAKWVPVCEITDASLGWFAVDSQNVRCFEVTRPKEETNIMKSRCDILGISYLWGPMRLPDPPKEPRKLRRFQAWKDGRRVSGVHVPEREAINNFLVITESTYWTTEDELENLQWIDSQ